MERDFIMLIPLCFWSSVNKPSVFFPFLFSINGRLVLLHMLMEQVHLSGMRTHSLRLFVIIRGGHWLAALLYFVRLWWRLFPFFPIMIHGKETRALPGYIARNSVSFMVHIMYLVDFWLRKLLLCISFISLVAQVQNWRSKRQTPETMSWWNLGVD